MSRFQRLAVVLTLAASAAACSEAETATTVEPTTATTSTVVAEPSTTTEPTTTTNNTTTSSTTTTEPATTLPTTAAPTTSSPRPTEPATTTVPVAQVDVRVYFARDERLAIAERKVDDDAVLEATLAAALAGPDDAEAEDGLFTLVPDGTSLLGVAVADGVATVDLSDEFESGGGTMAMQARIAQVVFTATQFDDVDAVLFWIEGQPVQFLGGEGIDLAEPWTRSDTTRDLTGGILVASPDPGDTVSSQFTVTGEGDVFEADFPLWVRRDGEMLGDVIIVQAGAWGTWEAFATDVTVDASPGPIELVMVDQSGCSPPECPEPTEIVIPLTLVD